MDPSLRLFLSLSRSLYFYLFNTHTLMFLVSSFLNLAFFFSLLEKFLVNQLLLKKDSLMKSATDCFTPVLLYVTEPTTTKDKGINVHEPIVGICVQYKELNQQPLLSP